MTRTRKMIVTLLVVFALLLVGGWFLVTQASSATKSVKNAAATTLFQNSGITDTINNALYAHDSEIADNLGISTDTVDSAISDLDIESWEVADLPEDATATGTYDYTYEGTDVTATLYDDPGYVTVNAKGQEITFAVPDSAQTYVTLLQQQS